MHSKAPAPLVALTAAMLVISSSQTLFLASSLASHNPVIRNDSVTSLNWSGYAVTGPPGSVTYVKGSWVVPAIQGTCPSTNQYSSHWVGMDGYESNTVEQTGTDSDCQSGAPTYYAWFEFYPHPSFLISGMTIHPGDVMTATVTRSGGRFTVSITDVTTGTSFSKTAKVSSAQASSAEWITEAPYSGGILPLADFGTIYWGGDNTGQTGTNFATVGGATGAIGSFGPNIHQITMVTGGGAVKASTSPLSTDGTSFSVTWASSGP